MRLFAVLGIAVLFQPGSISAQATDEALAFAVEELTREWFDEQLRDLSPEERQDQGLLEDDIAEMRDNVIRRISGVLETSDALADGVPDDAANAAAMARLVEAYEGLDSTTPVFTKLALSKADDPAYRSGWRLCAIRVIAETWLPQAEDMLARRNTSAQPPCEADLSAVQSDMLPLEPQRTEFKPGGSAVMEFIVESTGAVSNLWFVEWSVTPSDDFMRDYLTRSVQAWKFPPRENACRRQTTITLEMAEAE